MNNLEKKAKNNEYSWYNYSASNPEPGVRRSQFRLSQATKWRQVSCSREEQQPPGGQKKPFKMLTICWVKNQKVSDIKKDFIVRSHY